MQVAHVEAAAAGFTHFDTAPLYGFGGGERALGAAFASASDITIATKVGLYPPGGAGQGRSATLLRKAGGKLWPSLSRAIVDHSVERARASLESSLNRLQRDYVDLLLIHEPDAALLESEEWLRWLEDEEYRFRYLGIDADKNFPSRRKEVLYLGRLHPVKGIEHLLTAWAQVEARHPDWTLRIVGPGESEYLGQLKQITSSLNLRQVQFAGPLFGLEKKDAYRRASLFVLPTRSENFGMVVAEALAEKTPVICTKGAPWQGLELERCGWWIDHGPNELSAALQSALSMSDVVRAQMGERGRHWMRRDFGWHAVATRMAEVYSWCHGKGGRPDCVVQD